MPAHELPPGPVFDFHVRLAPRPGAVDRLLTVLDECGLDAATVCAGGTIDPLVLSRHIIDGGHIDTDADNDAVLAACQDSGGRLIPCYFANPHRPVSAYRARAAEFAALEISPAVHGIGLTDLRVDKLVEIAATAGHSVYVVCLQRPGSAVADLVALARRYPTVTFVLGHCGVGNIDYHGVELIADEANVMLETSGGYSSVVAAALARLGPSRVLFGSEYPLQHPRVELAKYAALDLEPDQWRQVAWDNATRLVSPAVPAPAVLTRTS
ncbi:amidohydrolase family protein [Actinophytocola sp.]|uniref:amidohydrolase family protein n=1 Tax=Actinophytocola sp. TaxID=1872138 RepID=UPI003D6B97CE